MRDFTSKKVNTMRALCLGASLMAVYSCNAPVKVPVNESGAETWSCRGRHGGSGTLLSVTVHESRLSGEVHVAGETQPAMFHVAGIDRRWDWGADHDGKYQYALVIMPNGDGAYLDFSSKSEAYPSRKFKCSRRR